LMILTTSWESCFRHPCNLKKGDVSLSRRACRPLIERVPPDLEPPDNKSS
jgi:hypothetical protein